MGAGVAKTIRDKWPVVYKSYLRELKQLGEMPWRALGNCQLVQVQKSPTLIVANLFAQYDYGRDYRRTEYGSLAISLTALLYEMQLFQYGNVTDFDVYIPYRIGCNNAGGDWSIVESIINKTFALFDNNVYICRHE